MWSRPEKIPFGIDPHNVGAIASWQLCVPIGGDEDPTWVLLCSSVK